MPQQINLCTAALTPQRQRFQARSLLRLLGIALLLLGVLGSFWLWSLDRSAQDYQQTLQAQSGEIQNLQAAIQRSRAASGPLDPALLRELQDKRSAVLEREKVLQALRTGLFRAGAGHSDRLLLLARSVPEDVWITSVRADGASLELAGFTLNPASLNAWVDRLGQSPLLQGQQLSGVKVSYVNDTAAARAKPSWSFSLQSQLPPPAPGEPTPGAKP